MCKCTTAIIIITSCTEKVNLNDIEEPGDTILIIYHNNMGQLFQLISYLHV